MKSIFSLCTVLFFCFLLKNDAAAQIILSYSTTDNTVCAPNPDCDCHGKLTSITLLYHGTSGVTIRVYKKSNFTNQNLITTLTNVSDGQIITVNGPGGGQFEPRTFFWIDGTHPSNAEGIHTSCSHVEIGVSYGPYTVIGYIDKDGTQCTMPLCTGAIDLTVTGGIPPYTYKWNNGGTAEDQSNLCSGIYRVRVKDDTGAYETIRISVSDASFVCDDGNPCTTDRCERGECRSKRIKCDDHDPCTIDECNQGVCVYTPLCDDGDACTTDQCSIEHGHGRHDHDDDDDDEDEDDDDDGHHGHGHHHEVICSNVPVNCDDDNLCTVDECADGQCLHTPVSCEDNNSCTRDNCINGQCTYTPIPGCGDPCSNVNCDDNDLCTEDVCNDGQCSNSPIVCDDQDACTTNKCQTGECVFTPIDCDDGNACTEDDCISGQCTNTPIPGCGDPCFNVNCDDNNFCTEDACNNGQCSNSPIVCDDQDACTTNECQTGECVFTPINCNDGNVCTEDDCSSGQCTNTPIPGCGDPCSGTDLTADAVGANPSPCEACNGTASVNVSGGTVPYSYLWSNGETTESIGGGTTSFNGTRKCIDAGSTAAQYISTTSDTFLADQGYAPGSPNTVTYTNNTVADIAGTIDDVMYRTERNIVAAGATMTYSIPVINGPYNVELFFAELFYGVAGGQTAPPANAPATWPLGMRLFDVSIEGVLVLNDYDINDDVGPATAVVKTFLTTVNDGSLNIAFTSVLNRAKVNGICVKPHNSQGGQGLCAGTYSVTVTDANGCEATADVSLCVNPCANVDCDDDDACTSDACNNGQCLHTQINCEDADACTSDACTNGECMHTAVVQTNVSSIGPDPCNECNGSATAIPAGGTPPYTYLWSTGETTQSIGSNQAGNTEKCINAGGPQYIASTGDTFLADQSYNPGTPGTAIYANNTVADILGTTDDVLYRTERNAVPPSTGTGLMSYNIPVANGQYHVELYFAEIYFGVPGGQAAPPANAPATWPVGMRQFDVSIEGFLVLNDYDINADVGPARAVIKTFTTTVNDGSLTIEFANVINRAKISGICIKPVLQSGGLCAGAYDVTVTDATGCSATGAAVLCNASRKWSDGSEGNDADGTFTEISELKVYPIPFENLITVDFNASIEGEAQLRMIDILGQEMKNSKVDVITGANKQTLDFDGTLAAGIYFLEVRMNDQVQYVKLMK